jgi:hypothetical protein
MPARLLDGPVVVVLVLVVVVVDDPQDLDEAEGSSQPPQGRLLLGVDLGHDPSRLPPWWLVASGPQVQVDPAALKLEVVDLALAVLLTPGLKGQQLGVPRKRLEGRQHLSYCHALRVAALTQTVAIGATRLGRHRWKVERSLSWLSCYRRLAIRWDRGSERFFAFVLLACALTCFARR